MATQYTGLIDFWKEVDWFEGVFWWNWTTDNNFGGLDNYCMDPKFKPAQYVLWKHYGGMTTAPPTPDGDAQCSCTL